MERKLLKRYLVFVGILIICAGAVWFGKNSSEAHHENAVLAYNWQNPESVAIA